MKKNSFQEGLEKSWQAYIQDERGKKYPNIMVVGISGAGKSDLINSVLGIKVAETSNIEPKTKGYCNFFDGHDYDRKINLIDTEGYELDKTDTYLDDITEAIKYGNDDSPIHVIWYCLSVPNERIEKYDIELLNELKNIEEIHGRLCIVFTKCEKDDDKLSRVNSYKQVLHNNGLGNIKSFKVSFEKSFPFEMDELITWSSEQFEDEDLRHSFIGSQMHNLDLKRREAAKIINEKCILVSTIGFTDWLTHDDKKETLAEHQMQMITSIFSIYGVDCLEGLAKKFEKSTTIVDFGNNLVNLIISIIPKTKKFHEFIKSAMAGALTKVVGVAASRASYYYVEHHIKNDPISFESLFTDSESANIIATFLDEAISKTGEWLNSDEVIQSPKVIKKVLKKTSRLLVKK